MKTPKQDDTVPPGYKIRTDLYELPALFGFWIEDPEAVQFMEKSLGEPYYPTVRMFFGQELEIRLAMVENEDDPNTVRIVQFSIKYRLGSDLDTGGIFLQEESEGPNGETVRGEEVRMEWAIHANGKLIFRGRGLVWYFVPATIDDIVAAGYPRYVIDAILEKAGNIGWEYVETFNEETAEELKLQYWQEIEDGLR